MKKNYISPKKWIVHIHVAIKQKKGRVGKSILDREVSMQSKKWQITESYGMFLKNLPQIILN